MKTTPLNPISLFPTLLFLSLAWSVCTSKSQALEDQIENTFSVQEGGLLSMDIDRGSLVLQTRPDIREIRIMVTRKVPNRWFFDEQKALDAHSMQFTPQENGLQITSEFQKTAPFKSGSNLQVTYEITVPETFECQIKTKGGSIEINRLNGNFLAETSGGSVKLGEILGAVNATTSGGRIELDKGHAKIDLVTAGGSIQVQEAVGYLNARTSGGGIQVSKALAGLYAVTGGGSIKLSDLEGQGAIRAVTTGGSVSAHFSNPPQHPVSLVTSGGSIDLRLPVPSSMI